MNILKIRKGVHGGRPGDPSGNTIGAHRGPRVENPFNKSMGNQRLWGSRGSMVAKLKVKGIDKSTPPRVVPAAYI